MKNLLKLTLLSVILTSLSWGFAYSFNDLANNNLYSVAWVLSTLFTCLLAVVSLIVLAIKYIPFKQVTLKKLLLSFSVLGGFFIMLYFYEVILTIAFWLPVAAGVYYFGNNTDGISDEYSDNSSNETEGSILTSTLVNSLDPDDPDPLNADGLANPILPYTFRSW